MCFKIETSKMCKSQLLQYIDNIDIFLVFHVFLGGLTKTIIPVNGERLKVYFNPARHLKSDHFSQGFGSVSNPNKTLSAQLCQGFLS